MKLRTFVCVELPAAERSRLGELQDRLRRFGARISWPAPATLHVTLAFLGDVDTSTVPSIVASVDRAARAARPFELVLTGSGTFPERGRPRVLWVGLGGDAGAIAALRTAIVDELAPLGFEPDPRPFSPHLTIGRVKEGHAPALADVVAALASDEVHGERFTVSDVVVMRSELDPHGARHTPIARIALGEPSDESRESPL